MIVDRQLLESVVKTKKCMEHVSYFESACADPPDLEIADSTDSVRQTNGLSDRPDRRPSNDSTLKANDRTY